jgi:hypothetical protein
LLILPLSISSKDLIKLLSLALEVGLLDKAAIVKDKAAAGSRVSISIIYKEAAESLYRAGQEQEGFRIEVPKKRWISFSSLELVEVVCFLESLEAIGYIEAVYLSFFSFLD